MHLDASFLITLAEIASTGLIASIIVLRVVPAVNQIARSKGLLNAPDLRTSHRYKTPNLGGIAIFIAICSSLIFIFKELESFKILFLASILIFFTGVKDDIVSISPWRKLLSQLGAATIITLSDIRFVHLFNLVEVQEFNEITSSIVTICAIIVLINAINLIDGIDGLAASIGSLIMTCFGVFFFINGMYHWTIYCAGVVGALLAFFQFNVFGLRNKTFMGDSGSMLLGLIIAFMTIIFWETNADPTLKLRFSATPAIALSIVIIPLFDTVRVFIYRISRHLSPFSADRNHLHHRFIDVGFTHFQTSVIITAFNLLMIAIAVFLNLYLKMGMIWIAVITVSLMLVFVTIINMFYNKRKETPSNRLKINQF